MSYGKKNNKLADLQRQQTPEERAQEEADKTKRFARIRRAKKI